MRFLRNFLTTISQTKALISLLALFSTASLGEGLLDASDFTYMGKVNVSGMGISTRGLAYRPSTNTYFTIAKGGLEPFYLIEFAIDVYPTVDKPVTTRLVKNWGPINNANDVLAIRSKALVSMRSLLWDPKRLGLWVNYGSFYANGENLPFMAFIKLTGSGMVVEGPWRVTSSTHSDRVKGILQEAPAELKQITGHRFMAFGSRGSTAQQQSWGVGLVSVEEPVVGLPPHSDLKSMLLIHWPMKFANGNAFSDYPRPQNSRNVYIKGNGDVGRIVKGIAEGGTANTITLSKTTADLAPVLAGWYIANHHDEKLKVTAWNNTTKVATVERLWTKIPIAGESYTLSLASYEQNSFFENSTFSSNDGIATMNYIQTPTKHGFLYFGIFSRGYSWYGNPQAHNDETPMGKVFQNNLDSFIYPGKKVISTSIPRGGHSEAADAFWFVLDPRDVYSAASKVKNQTADSATLQITHRISGEIERLGGSVSLQSKEFSQMYWNPGNRILYALNLGAGNGAYPTIHLWRLR